VVYAGSALWYCQPSSNLLTKRRSVGKGQGSSSLSRDFRRLSVMAGFVVVGSTIGMPARRFFPHTRRDSRHRAVRHRVSVSILLSTTVSCPRCIPEQSNTIESLGQERAPYEQMPIRGLLLLCYSLDSHKFRSSTNLGLVLIISRITVVIETTLLAGTDRVWPVDCPVVS
jgi:hypothetical protein